MIFCTGIGTEIDRKMQTFLRNFEHEVARLGQTICSKKSIHAVVYKSEDSSATYTTERKHFEKYIERVNIYWSETNKSYKNKKEKLKNEG